MVYIDDDVLPYHNYFHEGNSMATTEGSYLGSKESNTSDDDGHRECGVGGYNNCPDNPERHSKSGVEDSFDENKSSPGNADTTTPE